MTIHFTAEGIYADTEEERIAFLDKLCEGNPIIWGHLAIYERELELADEQDSPAG